MLPGLHHRSWTGLAPSPIALGLGRRGEQRAGIVNLLRLLSLSTAIAALSIGSIAYAQEAETSAEESETVMLRASSVTDDKETGTFIAEGDVEVRVGDRVLRADRVVYDREAGTMRAQGNVQVRDEDGAVQFADEFEVDEGFRNGFATGFSTRIGETGIATASAAIREEGTRNTLEQVVYTGCPLCEESDSTPTWSIRSRRAVQNQETQMISYQDAVLEIKGVPVIYIPYFAHPDPTSERRSGLLTPDLGISSKRGAFVEVPYYFSLSESSEVTITPQINAKVNPLLTVDYRKRFFSGFVDIETSFTNEQDFDSQGDTFGEKTWRSHVYGTGAFNITENWLWGFGLERQTDDLYDLRYDIDGEDDPRGLYTSQPRQLLSQVYLTGQDHDYYTETGLLAVQGLRAGDIEAQIPEVTPLLFAERTFDLKRNGQIAANFSGVGLFRDEAQVLPGINNIAAEDTIRLSGGVEWGNQYIVGPGLVFEPFGLVRSDYYRLDDGVGDDATDVSRTLGLAGVTASWPLVRQGENVDIVIEPIAMAAYGSEDANDPLIPNEDAILFEADESNIFRPQAVGHYDLWEGGARTALGVNAAATFNNGVEISGVVGRRWRSEPDPSFAALSNLSEEESDYVAGAKVDFGNTFSTGARVRFNDEFDFERVDANMRTDFWRITANARYFRIADNPSGAEDEGVLWTGEFDVTDRWSAIIRQQRNLTDSEDIRFSAGIAYRDDCSWFALTYERYGVNDRTLGPSDSIKFEFVLTGLGGVRDDSFD